MWWTFIIAANTLALFGFTFFRDVINAIFKAGLVAIVLFSVGCWYGGTYLYSKAKCTLGDNYACSEYVEYVPDNLSPQIIKVWNSQRAVHPDGWTGFNAWHLPRWSLSKTIWYDGEWVKVHRYCVVMDYPYYDDSHADQVCQSPIIQTGKHAGSPMPNMTGHHSRDFDELWAASPGFVGFNGVVTR